MLQNDIIVAIVVTVYLILFVAMIIDSIKRKCPRVILWVILNLFFPPVGMIGYFIDTRIVKEK